MSRPHARRHPRLLAAVLTTLALLAVPTPVVATGGALPSGSPDPDPPPSRVVVAGETVRIVGTVPGRVRRPVLLQRRAAGARWVLEDSARTDRRGRYRWAVAAPDRSTHYRVLAPARRGGPETLPAHRSRMTRVAVVSQVGAVRLPRVVREGTRATALARFTPARPGRRVVLQVQRDGWRTVASGRQDATGRVGLTTRVDRTARYRAVALRHRGAPAHRTAPVAVAAEPAPSGGDPWVTGYYAGWFWDQGYGPEQVDVDAMTHLVFGRVAPGGGSLGGAVGTVVEGAGTAHDPGTAPDGVRSVEDDLVARAHTAGTKALLMLGGDGGDGRGFTLSASDRHRARFVDAVVDHLVEHDYDGVDVDWENCLADELDCGETGTTPIAAAEKRRRLMALIADLRTETATRARYADEPALITLPGYPLNTNDLGPGGRAPAWQAELARSVDQYNLMSYGVGTTWWGHGTGWQSWFSGALTGASPSTPVDVASSVAAYEAAGVPRSRMGIGIGFYGIYYGPTITGPRQYDVRNDVYEVDDTALAYGTLVEKGYLSHGTQRWDEDAQSTYRSYGDGRPTSGYVPALDPDAQPAGMLSYEDARSIRAKADWVERTGVGGTILWTINYGWVPSIGRNPLLEAVEESFG